MDASDEIMTIEELAKYLKISKSSLYRLAQAGKIPGQKVGKQWRFRKQAIDRWLENSGFERQMMSANNASTSREEDNQ